MTLKIIIDVDDLNPSKGYGLNELDDPIQYLIKLNKEFGCKFTCFVVPMWHNQVDMRQHKEWVDWIKSLDFIEIAVHGLTHMGNKPELGAMEFINIAADELKRRVIASKQIFNSLGCDVNLFKIPGWEAPPIIYQAIKDVGFKGIADHFIGSKSLQLSNGLWRIPYTLSIDKLHSDHYKDTVILHSHISRHEGNKNGWNEELYQLVRRYIKKLIEENNGDIQFITMGELIKHE